MVRFAFHQIVLANSIQNLPFISKLTEPFFRISKSHSGPLFPELQGRRAELPRTSMEFLLMLHGLINMHMLLALRLALI